MTQIKEYAGLVALIVLAIMGLSGFLKSSAHLAGSTSCGSITCLAGGLRLVSDLGGTFESDVAATLASVVVTAGETIGTTLQVTGLTSLSTLNTTGRIAVATTSPSSMGNVVISGTGTTTLMIATQTGAVGTGIQMINSAGALVCLSINGATPVTATGSCK